MGAVRLFQLFTARCLLLLFVLLLCHVILASSGPLHKKKIRSLTAKNASAEHQQQQLSSNQSFNFLPEQEQNKKNLKLNQIIDKSQNVGLAPAKHHQTEDEDDKVGKLPDFVVNPYSRQFNKSVGNKQNSSSDAGKLLKNTKEEQGVAVGVGAMNRHFVATTKKHQAYHKGPDNSLDIGAADRQSDTKSNAEQQVNPVGANDLKEGVVPAPNPAMQQPPPQEREPPVNQFHEKETHLGPMNPQVVLPSRISSSPEHFSNDNKFSPPVLAAPNKDDNLKFDPQLRNSNELREPLKLDEFKPPDHIEGFRIEHDGHLNRDYRKEIFLGHHEEFEWSDEEQVSGKLRVMFRRADKDDDGFLGVNEVQEWIMINVRVHLEDADKDNKKVFKHLDADRNDLVSWTEFFSHFLVAKGYVRSAKQAQLNATLGIDDSELILKYKYRWAEADTLTKDDQLDVKEMMNFRHPEQNPHMIDQLVKDLIDNVDKDNDGIITEAEFVALPYDLGGQEILEIEGEWQEERKKEFQEVIDLNKNGKADEEELKLYFNPHNENHAKIEAENLIKMADQNNDDKLSIDEVLNNTDLFLRSKMVDAKRKLHDEF